MVNVLNVKRLELRTQMTTRVLDFGPLKPLKELGKAHRKGKLGMFNAT